MTESLMPPASNGAVPYSPEWLNALTDAEKQSLAMSDFSRSLHDSGGEHVAWLLWSTQEKAKPTPLEYRQGSMFFLDCGRGPFAVTAGHVFEQFVKDRAELRVRGCQIGNVGFNPEERLIDWGRDRKIDLATFSITSEDIAAMGKKVVRGTDGRWPAPPNVDEVVYFGGFLGHERIEVATREFSFGLHSGMVPLTDMTEYQLCCRFDRRYWWMFGALARRRSAMTSAAFRADQCYNRFTRIGFGAGAWSACFRKLSRSRTSSASRLYARILSCRMGAYAIRGRFEADAPCRPCILPSADGCPTVESLIKLLRQSMAR